MNVQSIQHAMQMRFVKIQLDLTHALVEKDIQGMANNVKVFDSLLFWSDNESFFHGIRGARAVKSPISDGYCYMLKMLTGGFGSSKSLKITSTLQQSVALIP